MNTLSDLLALLVAILVSTVFFMPDAIRIFLSLLNLMLVYFFFKYANKYISLIPLILFFILTQSVYHFILYDVCLFASLSFMIYTFFYVTWSRVSFQKTEERFIDLEVKIKEFLNILTAFDYIPNKIKIFDELTEYMKSIFPEVYSIAIFQKTPFGWKCKSSKGFSPSIKNVYLNEINMIILNRYFLIKNSELFNIPVNVEGDKYIISYNCIEEPSDKELMEYFFKTLLLLSLRFEKKYFLGLENALVSEDGLIYYDIYKKFSQTLLEIVSSNNGSLVFAIFLFDKDRYKLGIKKLKSVFEPTDLLISMSSDKVLAIFSNKTVGEIKKTLNFDGCMTVFAQYPEDGLDSDDIINLLEQRLTLKSNDAIIR